MSDDEENTNAPYRRMRVPYTAAIAMGTYIGPGLSPAYRALFDPLKKKKPSKKRRAKVKAQRKAAQLTRRNK